MTIQARNPSAAEGNTNGYTYVAFSSINGVSDWGYFNGIPTGNPGSRWFPRSADGNKDEGMMKEESKKEQEDLGFQYSAKADEEKGNPRAIPIYEYD